MDWSDHYPDFVEKSEAEEEGGKKSVPKMTKEVEVADIGCGFGGLLVALSPVLPDTLLLGTSKDNPPRFLSLSSPLLSSPLLSDD